jgi:uncharacterized damage-inducible protein DinB
MANLELLTSLCLYNRWANRRMLDAMKDLSPADFDCDLAGSFPSLHQTLVHILWVEQLFLRRWRAISTADIAEPPKFDTVAAIRTAWESLEKEREEYWDRLTDADLIQPIDYVDTRGNPSSMILWESMYHLFNHSTFHRGQAASKLRQLGIAPPSTDFVIYCRETMKDRQD